MKNFGLIVIFSLSLFFSKTVYGECSKLHLEMIYTVAQIESASGGGSGVVIYSSQDTSGKSWKTLLITNHHVIKNSIKITEEWSSDKGEKVQKEHRLPISVGFFQYNKCSKTIGQLTKRGRIFSYDETLDLAIIELNDTERGVPYVANFFPEDDNLQLADPVYVVGAGLGAPPFTTQGLIGVIDLDIGGIPHILATAEMIFGNSGGGIFRFSKSRNRYELIGVPRATLSSLISSLVVSHMGISVRLDSVRKFLKENDLSFIDNSKYMKNE